MAGKNGNCGEMRRNEAMRRLIGGVTFSGHGRNWGRRSGCRSGSWAAREICSEELELSEGNCCEGFRRVEEETHNTLQKRAKTSTRLSLSCSPQNVVK